MGIAQSVETQWRHQPQKLIHPGVSYQAQYLGSTLVRHLRGTESTKRSIEKLKAKTPSGPSPTNGCYGCTMILAISLSGVLFLEASTQVGRHTRSPLLSSFTLEIQPQTSSSQSLQDSGPSAQFWNHRSVLCVELGNVMANGIHLFSKGSINIICLIWCLMLWMMYHIIWRYIWFDLIFFIIRNTVAQLGKENLAKQLFAVCETRKITKKGMCRS